MVCARPTLADISLLGRDVEAHYGRAVSNSLSELLVRFRKDPSVRAAFDCPVLVWEAPASTGGEHWERTRGHNLSTPLAGDPRIFRVEKGAKANNAFACGITLGRVDTNDLVL